MGRQSNVQDSLVQGGINYDDPNSNLPRHYRKKKTWSMTLKISIETPELDHKLDESFEIEIGSNQTEGAALVHPCHGQES